MSTLRRISFYWIWRLIKFRSGFAVAPNECIKTITLYENHCKYMIIFKLIGFENYIIKDKILYRKEYKIKDKKVKFKYISERKIKRVLKDGIDGYFLVRGKNRKFYSLKKLRHRLKRVD